MAVSARLATCQRALRLERVIFESNGPDCRYIGHLRAFQTTPNVTPSSGSGGTKKPPSPAGDERCLGPWYHPTSSHGGHAMHFSARLAIERCGDSVTGVSWPFGPRRRLLGRMAVRSEARRSFSPDRSTPLHTNRGSLRPHVRVLVLLDALAFLDCIYATNRCEHLSSPDFERRNFLQVQAARSRAADLMGRPTTLASVQPPELPHQLRMPR